MQMVKIKFQDPLQDARGALELAKRFGDLFAGRHV